MQRAINFCKDEESIKRTAKSMGWPMQPCTVQGKTGRATPKLGRFRPVFNEDQEIELITYLKDMHSEFFDLTRDEFKNVA